MESETRDMSVDPNALSSLAVDYAEGMTRIRGRRVQRLVKREFAGAADVRIVQVAPGRRAVLGLSEAGAAFCETDGRGKEASVVLWRHGADEAIEFRFDLQKDALPVSGSRSVPTSSLPETVRAHSSERFPETSTDRRCRATR